MRHSLGPCRRCGQMMLWVMTEGGKNMPLDPEPDPERGTVVLRASDNRAIVFPDPVEAQDHIWAHDGEGPYVAHFATCPERPRATPASQTQEQLL